MLRFELGAHQRLCDVSVGKMRKICYTANIHEYLDSEYSLYELNELSRRLGSMDRGQLAAFEGLFQTALKKRKGHISKADLLTYANSTDRCHVVGEALNDSQLGRIYAENGFVSGLDDLPDDIFELLDFEQIGRKARLAEGGTFTERGCDTAR